MTEHVSDSPLVKPAAGRNTRSLWLTLVELQSRLPLLQLVALTAVVVYGVSTLPGLATWGSIKTILVISSLIGLASLGQTLVILIGGFDLSLPSFMVATALLVTAIADKRGAPFILMLAIALVLCGGVGGFAGWICHRYDVQPLIVTLGMGAVVLGLVQTQTTNQMVGGSSQWASDLASRASTTFGIDLPPVVAIWIAVGLIAAWFVHRTVLGRRLMATGSNQRAAEYSLINTRKFWVVAFAFSGVSSALVSLLVGGFAGTLDSTVANPYLFQSVVAVIVGGTIFGGPGDYTRTIVGAFFLAIVTIVLTGHGVQAPDQQILYGIVLLLAVTLYGRERRISDRV
jgi:ribose transport system permease protein